MPKHQPPRADVPTLLRDVDLAARLRISRSFIHKLNSTGGIPAPVRLGRSLRWRISDVELWEQLGMPRRDSSAWREAISAGDGR